MTSQEGLDAFMTAYNVQLLRQNPNNSSPKKLEKLFPMPSPVEEQLLPTKTSERKKKTNHKGFGTSEQSKRHRPKKKS